MKYLPFLSAFRAAGNHPFAKKTLKIKKHMLSSDEPDGNELAKLKPAAAMFWVRLANYCAAEKLLGCVQSAGCVRRGGIRSIPMTWLILSMNDERHFFGAC
ncbi:hypothetical protein [Methylovirgula sp. HY1]|uniref:hypothetical protein n=1 Tax=Methylovirgula sp. HY1 TaxID=2822761 RepID=UPI001C5AD6C4|nr:hypothetical protein [Methylovirgula sp. HY1]